MSGKNFSLGHLLIDSIPGGVITIRHGDQEAITADDCGGVQRRASRRLLRRLLRREIASLYETFATDGS